MAYNINIPDTEWSKQTVTLSGTKFILILKYKERLDRWFMTLQDSSGVDLLTEKKIVDGQLITGLFDIENVYGDIVCQRMFGTDVYPTRDTLGINKAFNLVYLTADEVNDIFILEDLDEVDGLSDELEELANG